MKNIALKFRFYPTDEQVQLLAQTFGCVRFIYNHILRWRTDEYYQNQHKIDYLKASAKLTQIKKLAEFAWLNDVSSVALQQAIRHQQSAFKNFFEGRTKYPTFKKKNGNQSATLTQSAFKYTDGKVYIAKSKTPLDIRWSRELPSNPSSITISKDCAGRYFVSCLCEFEPIPLLKNDKKVGIDVGIKHLLVTSDGEKIDNPKYFAKYEKKLAKAQKALSRKQKGSNNRTKARLKVARIHAKIKDCRLDNLHKLSRRIINENQVICVEKLRIKNLVKNPKLAKHISDCSWGAFVRQLEYKADWGGRTLVKIDQFYPSSKRCSNCGYTLGFLKLDTREWVCPECGVTHDRDINASINIRTAGLVGIACRENVSLV